MGITTYNSNMDRTTPGMWLSQDPWRAPTLSVPQVLDCGVVSHFPSKPDEGVLCEGNPGLGVVVLSDATAGPRAMPAYLLCQGLGKGSKMGL